MRLLITGGSSYLGQHLVSLAAGNYDLHYTFFQHDPQLPGHPHQLDLRAATAVAQLVQQIKPDAIVHTAGSNRVSDMARVICDGTRFLAGAAARVRARLVHLSTDSIFNGRIDDPHPPPYTEAAPPSPVNDYGRAKAAAEKTVQQYPHHVIIRTSLIYGLKKIDHGTAWMASALQAGQPVTLFTNQVRNPVWVETLSLACLELVQHDYTGILNVAGNQTLTRADFGLRMLDWWLVRDRATLRRGPSTGGSWPLDCRLDLTRAAAVLTTPLPGVDQVLQQKGAHSPPVS